MAAQFLVIGIKKDGGTRNILGVYKSNILASEAALAANMDIWEDVFVEADDGTPKPPRAPVVVLGSVASRTHGGLRDALFDEIDAFRSGKGEPARAIAISKLAAQILSSARIEHEIARFRATDGSGPAPMQLGRNASED